jgi:hypothetical protein
MPFIIQIAPKMIKPYFKMGFIEKRPDIRKAEKMQPSPNLIAPNVKLSTL